MMERDKFIDHIYRTIQDSSYGRILSYMEVLKNRMHLNPKHG